MTRPRILAVAFVVAVLVVIFSGTESGPNSLLEERSEGATETRDGRGRGASTLPAGSLAVLGTLLGVTVGLLGDRYLRHRGEILYRSSDWNLTCTLRNLYDQEPIKHAVPFDRAIPNNERLMARAEYGNYECSVNLFNEKEMATGLRDITVVFVDESGTPMLTNVPDLINERGVLVGADSVNLPARQWVSRHLHGRLRPEEFEAVARSTRVEMKAYLPKDKPFVRELTRLWE